MKASPVIAMNDGRSIPQLGIGTWQISDGEDLPALVADALRLGYRHVDTARAYGNENGTGLGLAASGVPREEIFLTTKLWNDEHDREAALAAIDTSLERLGTDYVDLFLIHWAKPEQGKYVEAWKSLIEIQQSGKALSIGVSNFPEPQLEEIIAETGVVPAVHQIELHPYWQQRELRRANERHGILTQAYSPLGSGGAVLHDDVVAQIAAERGASPAQVIIAWHLAIGNVVIPKSTRIARLAANFEALDLTLGDEDIARIDALDRSDGRVGRDPVNDAP